MNKPIRNIKKHWITIWLIVAAVALITVSTYAIYTRITMVKRVVSTQAGANSLFSSDHMNAALMKVIEPVMDSSKDADVVINVFNYAYPKESVFRGDLTQYDITATIGSLGANDSFTALTGTDLSGLSTNNYNYKIKHNDTNETFIFGTNGEASYTFQNRSIAGGAANNDEFTVTFDKNEVGNTPNGYCIKLVATPYNSDLPVLTGIVMVRFSKQASTGWSGELEEINEAIEDDYDGYNYYLEGNARGKLTFSWDPGYVTINKDFLNNRNNVFYSKGVTTNEQGEEVVTFTKYTTPPVESALIPDAETHLVSLTIEVDSMERNRYEIQFFKTNSKTYNYTKNAVEGYLPSTNPSDWVSDE